jgi:integrase
MLQYCYNKNREADMPSIKLNQKIVDGLEATDKLVTYFDQGLKGFGVYTTKNAKTYFIQARVNGKEIKRTIGKASLVKYGEARKDAKIILAQMSKGIDPEAEKQSAELAGMTLRQTFERYQKDRQLKPRTIKCYNDLLKSYTTEWLDKPISNITKELIAEKHKNIGKDHGENAANNLMRTIRSLYNFAYILTEEKIPSNPVLRLSQTRQWYKVERRHTFLKPHELKFWYDAVQKIENTIIRDYLLMIAFTGLRKQEGLQLKWAYIDMQDRSLTLPGKMTKNGKPHTLPLSQYLYSLFIELQKRKINEYVFPGTGVTGHLVEPKKQMNFISRHTLLATNGISDQAEFNKRMADNPESILPGISFTLHDLRRTFITVAESIDISYAALKRLLNHADGNDVTGGYLQITTDRLRDPMERISLKLMELMGIYPNIY